MILRRAERPAGEWTKVKRKLGPIAGALRMPYGVVSGTSGLRPSGSLILPGSAVPSYLRQKNDCESTRGLELTPLLPGEATWSKCPSGLQWLSLQRKNANAQEDQ